MKKVKFKNKIGIRNKGEIVNYEDAIADNMVKMGFAEIAEKPKPKAKPKAKK